MNRWLGCAIAGAGREFWVAFGGCLTGKLVRHSFETTSMAVEELPIAMPCEAGKLALVETPTSHTWLIGGCDGALRAARSGASSSGETACNITTACTHCIAPAPVLSQCQNAYSPEVMQVHVGGLSQNTQCAS